MGQQGSDDRLGVTEPTSAVQLFEQALERARKLIESHDLDAAVAVLHGLEKRYLTESRLFDLLGEVLLLQGKIEEGIRYRALYSELQKTLNAARESISAYQEQKGIPPGPGLAQTPIAASFRTEEHGEPYRQTPVDLSFAPVTLAMGQELMKQGHFDRALAIFSVLVERNPGDERLREARDQARRKSRDQRTLRALGHWLKNIERMKAEHSIET